MLTSCPSDMAMARIIWSSSDMVRSFTRKELHVNYPILTGKLGNECMFYASILTLTAPTRRGGGCVRRYSVACSMVLVFSRASEACSLEKPISISWNVTKQKCFFKKKDYRNIVWDGGNQFEHSNDRCVFFPSFVHTCPKKTVIVSRFLLLFSPLYSLSIFTLPIL